MTPILSCWTILAEGFEDPGLIVLVAQIREVLPSDEEGTEKEKEEEVVLANDWEARNVALRGGLATTERVSVVKQVQDALCAP